MFLFEAWLGKLCVLPDTPPPPPWFIKVIKACYRKFQQSVFYYLSQGEPNKACGAHLSALGAGTSRARGGGGLSPSLLAM